MTKRVLSVLLALALVFSAIAEETPQAEEPVEEVTIEQEEAQDKTDTESGTEEVEEKPAERCVEVVSEAVTIPAVETAKESVSEVTVNEPGQENQTESLPSDIQVDDKGSTESVLENGTEQKEVSASEETLEIESESEGKDIQISEQGDLVEDIKDESTEEKQTVPEVSEEDEKETTEDSRSDDGTDESTSSEEHTEDDAKPEQTEEYEDAPEEESTDAGDVKDDDELDERPEGSDGESTEPDEEEEAEEAEEEDPDESEEVESEDEGMEDGSEVETEEADQEQTVEELDDETADDVSGGTSVLDETEEALMAAAPTPMLAMATSSYGEYDEDGNWHEYEDDDYRRYSFTISVSGLDHTILTPDDEGSTKTITFTPDAPDSGLQYEMYVGGKKISSGNLWSAIANPTKTFSITYGDLYDALGVGTDIEVKVRCVSNAARVYALEKESHWLSKDTWEWKKQNTGHEPYGIYGTGTYKCGTLLSWYGVLMEYTESFSKYVDVITAKISYNSSIDYYPGDPITVTGSISVDRYGQDVTTEYNEVSYEWYVNDEKVDATSKTYSFYVPDCTTLTVKVIIGYTQL